MTMNFWNVYIFLLPWKYDLTKGHYNLKAVRNICYSILTLAFQYGFGQFPKNVIF